MKTVYEARDRQGVKYFKKKPEFVPLHDIFVGEQIAPLTSRGVARIRSRYRVVRRFTANVQQRHIFARYPKTIKVQPTP